MENLEIIGHEAVQPDSYRTYRAIDQIKRDLSQAQRYWDLRFPRRGRTLVIHDPSGVRPFVVHDFYDGPDWVLGSDPQKWQYHPQPAIFNAGSNPSEWGYGDICREIGRLRASSLGDPREIDLIRSGHQKALSLWLLFDVCLPEIKDQYREMLHTTELVHLLPWSDYSHAKKEFARRIYSWSELAQRAGSEDLLWFCMEYASCLQLASAEGLSKASAQSSLTLAVRHFREALRLAKNGEWEPENYSIDAYVSQGEDWRLHIQTLLIYDAIRLVGEAESGSKEEKDRTFAVCQFINAIEHHNKMTHSPNAVVIKELADGTASRTKVGRPPANKPKRGRGRPPKGAL
jgi:hypothetical protein